MTRKEILVSRLDELVKNKVLVGLVSDYLDTVPAVFWTAPASSSGRFHPEFDLGDGGTFRHKIVALAFGDDLCRFFGATEDEHDAALCAIAIHDTYKGGPGPEWTETVRDHGPQAAVAWRRFCIERLLAGSEVPVDLVIDITIAVDVHMGVWAFPPKRNDEMSTVSKIVATADFMSTRKLLNPGAIDELLIGCY